MDESRVLQAVLRGVMGGRKKRGRRTMNHLLGSSGSLWSNPQVLLTAAGLAWGLIESATNQSNAAPAASGGGQGPPGQPPGQPSGQPSGQPLPPLPVVSQPPPAGPGLSDAQRLMRLAISAGHADGAMSPAEVTEVRRIAAEQGADGLVAAELERPSPLAEIVAGVSDAGQRRTLYGLAFAVVRADEQVSGAERIYLAQLAHLLGLDAATAADIERTTAARIESADDSTANGRG
jgi:uncharacterized membrane protein YebE (DUF533 family)